MARSRNIKPGFFTNEKLAELPALSRLLFAGLWCEADREGRLEDRPKRIKVAILPYDDCDANELLGQLERAGFIQRYRSGELDYIQIVNFQKHQNPHVKEAASTIPEPDLHCASTVQAPEIPERAGLIPDSLLLIPDSLDAPHQARKRVEKNYSLPDNVDREVWDAFLEMRKKKRASPTDRAVSLIFAELEKLRGQGHAPNDVLDQSTRNGWLDVFPIRNKGPQGRPVDWQQNEINKALESIRRDELAAK